MELVNKVTAFNPIYEEILDLIIFLIEVKAFKKDFLIDMNQIS